MGFGEEEAVAAAESTIRPNQRLTLIDGAKKAMAALSAPAKVSNSSKEKRAIEIPSYDHRPNDYRRAISAAKLAGGPVLTHMRALRLVRPLNELLELR
jgi:hypothetical protein